jgi:hypothetical protein
MSKPNLLSAARMVALLLTTPAMARQGQLTSQRLIANARITTTANREGKPAAEIAPVICVGLGSAMCGAGTYCGQWFPTVP